MNGVIVSLTFNLIEEKNVNVKIKDKYITVSNHSHNQREYLPSCYSGSKNLSKKLLYSKCSFWSDKNNACVENMCTNFAWITKFQHGIFCLKHALDR